VGPTDDDADYGRIAGDLADALIEAIPPWLVRAALSRVAESGMRATADGSERIRRAAATTATALEPRLREVLLADVDAGGGSPLALVRDSVGPVTAVLHDLGVTPSVRDEFARRRFPDDLYDLAPASFADVDESLHEHGSAWGAARAYVHLRRRQETGS
jgi:hypothetical protein